MPQTIFIGGAIFALVGMIGSAVMGAGWPLAIVAGFFVMVLALAVW